MLDHYNQEEKLSSLDSEVAVIGSLLSKHEIALDVCQVLSPNDFYYEDTRNIFAAINQLFEQGKKYDPFIVAGVLEQKNQLEQIGGLQALARTVENNPSTANVMQYATNVLDYSKMRQIRTQGLEVINAVNDFDVSIQDRLNNVQAIIANVSIDDDEEELTFEEMNKRVVLDIENAATCKGLTGISTGFKDIDNRFHGLQKQALYILAARPSMGKTTLALNIAKHVAKTEHVLIFSLEMPYKELIKKFYSMSGAPLKNILTANFDNQDSNKMLNVGVADTKNLKMTIDDRPSLKPQQVRAKALRVKAKQGLGLIVIDYLGLMTVNKPQSTVADTTEISKAMKALAKELDVPVICLSQLNRDCEKRRPQIPQLSDLRDSGSIEQDADSVIFIYRDEYYAERENRKTDQKGIAQIITSKNRAGEVGSDYMKTELHLSRFKTLHNYQPPEAQETDDKENNSFYNY